jgi:hypothetical protein
MNILQKKHTHQRYSELLVSDLLLSLLSLIFCIAEPNLTKFGRVGPWEEEFQNCSNEVDIQWGCMVV